jgi:hypothetical protein
MRSISLCRVAPSCPSIVAGNVAGTVGVGWLEGAEEGDADGSTLGGATGVPLGAAPSVGGAVAGEGCAVASAGGVPAVEGCEGEAAGGETVIPQLATRTGARMSRSQRETTEELGG